MSTPHDTTQGSGRLATGDAVAQGVTTREAVARRPAPAREGAAMLIVMLVLLMTTGVAVFAVHTTTAEIRAAGAARQALQTQYVAEAGLMSAIAYSELIQPAGVELALEVFHLFEADAVALGVGVLDAEHERAARVACVRPVEQGGTDEADVRRPRG